MTLLYNPKRMACEVVAAALQPPPPIDLLAFAEQQVVFTEGPFQGPYNRALFPFFDAILHALGPSDPCRYVTLVSSAQVGKTTLGNIFALASMTLRNGSVLVAHPTTDAATRWSKMKLRPLMLSMPIVREQFPQRAHDSQASVLYKERRDGLARLLITGANSPASLSQITIENQIQDDLAKWEPGINSDPELMADSRSRAIADAKIFKISTPLIEPGCRITKNFMEGSQEHGFVACPHCNVMQTLEWDNMAALIDPDRPEKACFSCVACGGLIEVHHRPQMLASFEWRAANPGVKDQHRSFSIWSAYSYLQSWEQIVREWLKARGDPASEATFWNDTLGRPYETRGNGRPWEELKARADKSNYARGIVPRGAYLLMLGADNQLDRIEWVVVGFGERYQRFIVDYGTIGKHIAEPDAQRNLDLLLDRKWTTYCGKQMGISCAALDANYSTDDVLAYVRRQPLSKVIAVRGAPGDSVPRIAKVRRERDEKHGTLRKHGGRFYNLGVNTLKMSLYRDLLKDDPTAPGYVAFPTGLEDRFFQELVSEQRVATKLMGQIIWKWEKPDRQANEMLDATIYASAAAIKFGVNWISDNGWAKLRAEFGGDPPSGAPTTTTNYTAIAAKVASKLAH